MVVYVLQENVSAGSRIIGIFNESPKAKEYAKEFYREGIEPHELVLWKEIKDNIWAWVTDSEQGTEVICYIRIIEVQ